LSEIGVVFGEKGDLCFILFKPLLGFRSDFFKLFFELVDARSTALSECALGGTVLGFAFLSQVEEVLLNHATHRETYGRWSVGCWFATGLKERKKVRIGW
jgi:hypothetical protein